MFDINRILGKYIPEQRLYIRSDKTTRYVRLSPLLQTSIGLGIATSICWTILASSSIVINSFIAVDTNSDSTILQANYQERLGILSNERDQRTLETQTAQERFYVALEQISQQQSKLLEGEEQRRELATGIKIMQRKLQNATKKHDSAQKKLQKLQATSKRLGNSTDEAVIENTLNIITEALETTSKERDTLLLDTVKMHDHIAALEFDSKLLQERGNEIFSRLEDAVDVSLVPLKRNLNRKGVNIDSLLREVKRGYSGTGGPLAPLLISSKSIFQDKISNRANGILKDLDRVNLLKLAARKVPIGHPVSGSYRYTSAYGYRRDPKNGGKRLHKGRDMAAPKGTSIIATGDGVISFAGRQSGFGKLVKIRHSQGFETFYAHLNRIRVKNGQRISRGQRIGDMGTTGRSTGVHLHYEIRIHGKPVNPANYMRSVN